MKSKYNIFTQQKERPISFVPVPVLASLIFALVLQLFFHNSLPDRSAIARQLPVPMDDRNLQLMGLGDKVALSKYLMLWLQAFDNQPGVSIPFKELDYNRVIGWLQRVLWLDPFSQYPLLSASRIYTEVPDLEKKRLMLAFVVKKFLEDPGRRWPWMAHAVYVAKYHLKDLNLALEYARTISATVSEQQAPAWARQMEIYVLEDMGQIESAKVLIGALLDSGDIRDENELRYLKYRLDLLEQKSISQ